MMKRLSKQTILLIEKDSDSALLIEENLRQAGIGSPVVVRKSCGEALAFLSGQNGRGDGAASPHVVVLLDAATPLQDAYDLLKKIKQDHRMRSVPIVALAASGSPEEVERYYQLGCNLCIVKPAEPSLLPDVVQKLGMFLSIITTPELNELHG